MKQWQKRDNPGVIVEASRVNEETVEVFAALYNLELVEETDPEHPQETQWGLNVTTPRGVQRCSLGMYLIKFGNHFYVSHTRPFEEIYMPVEGDAPPPESIGESRRARGFADPFGGPGI